MLRRYGKVLGVLAAAAALTYEGCDCGGTSSIELSASPPEIAANGVSYTTITARVIYRDSAVEDGTRVSFDATDGSFDDPGSGNLQGSGETTAGNATVKLYSSTTVGTVTVNASFVTQNEDTVTGSTTVKFSDVGHLTPLLQRNFEFFCDSRNIGALDTSLGKVLNLCHATAKTNAGEPIPRPQVKFLTESGTFTTYTPDDTSSPQLFVYTADGSGPWDVDPLPDEPNVTDAQSRIRNPRDGLVTVVAYAKGSESYTDVNGNGKYDEGEPFEDIGEPFTDCNDNGVWDEGEPFFDANGNGKYDGPNGRYDEDTYVWKAFKFLWTGPMDKDSSDYSGIVPSSINVDHKGSQSFKVTIVDANLNPLAANDLDDYVSIELEGGESNDTGDKPYIDSNTPGMTVVQGLTGDEDVQGGFDQKRTWSVTVSDPFDHDDPDDAGYHIYSSRLKVYLNYTPGPKFTAGSYDQYLSRMQSDALIAEGTIK